MSLKNKILIFNADDFGHSHPFNIGIMKGLKSKVLTTSCVLANTEGYSEAVSLISELKEIRFGIHLNLFEGKSLTKDNLLCDSKNIFNNGYVDILKKSNDKDFLYAIEKEFRAQIEKIMGDFKINHINSHIHIHSIPNIFKLTVMLMDEYKIPYVRTQYEKPYFSKPIPPVNLAKLGILNFLSGQNKEYLKNHENKLTNDYLIGVTYTGHMDKKAVINGLKSIKEGVVEILIHPAFYESKILKPNNYKEYLITQDETILNEISNLGYVMRDCSLEPSVCYY